MDPEDHPTRPLLAPTAEDISEVSVFPLIHRIKQDTIVRPSAESIIKRTFHTPLVLDIFK